MKLLQHAQYCVKHVSRTCALYEQIWIQNISIIFIKEQELQTTQFSYIHIYIYIYIYIYILFIYSCNSNNNHTTRSYNLLTLTLIQINFCRITPLHLFQDYDQHKPRVFTALDTIINQHIRSNMSSTMFLMLTHSDTTNPHTPYQTIF